MWITEGLNRSPQSFVLFTAEDSALNMDFDRLAFAYPFFFTIFIFNFFKTARNDIEGLMVLMIYLEGNLF